MVNREKILACGRLKKFLDRIYRIESIAQSVAAYAAKRKKDLTGFTGWRAERIGHSAKRQPLRGSS
jgi:hypothetical protein